MTTILTRRSVLAGAGALIVSWRLAAARRAGAQTETGVAASASLPGDLPAAPWLDAWLRIDASGTVTLFTGKGELGQGLKTALLQIAAEELKVPMAVMQIVTADTARTPNEGYTAASHSMSDSGTAIRHAAAQVRVLLMAEAARRWNLDPSQVTAAEGHVLAGASHSIPYGELVSDTFLHVAAAPTSTLTDPSDFTLLNHPVPRVDIPAKVTGGAAFIQDMRPPGMLHARVVRPPSLGATITAIDTAPVEAMPDVVRVVQNGSFLAVVAEKEWSAIQAMRRLSDLVTWAEVASLPDEATLAEYLPTLPSQDQTILAAGEVPEVFGPSQSFFRPYLAHGSIGPSCALALWQDGALTVWSHSQGVFPLRNAIAQMLGLSQDKVRCIHAEGSGCYGHNGADDAAADAALIALAVPGRTIRVQWMREQEHTSEPFGPGMVTRIAAALGPDGAIASWHHEVWSQSHMMRPGPAGTLLAAREMENPAPPAPPVPLPQPEGGGDRNAIPLYVFQNARVISHFLPEFPLRGSSMRSLGGYLNVMTIESTMADLARASGQDQVEFRLRHLQDPRARAVVEKAAEAYGWDRRRTGPGLGHGFAFARYKNLEAYCAVALELTIDPDTAAPAIGRVVAAVDTGSIVNPDGVRNQVEGGIIQSASWTLFERVRFDRTRVTTSDWSSYPILRFANVPASIEVHLIDRPTEAFLGAGETAQGPTGAALANAIADATGLRLRAGPMTAEAIRRGR